MSVRRIFFPVYRASTAITYWIRTRLSPGGFLVFAAMITFGVFGIDTNFTMAYQAFALFAALLLISFVASLISRAHFSGERFLPRFGTVGVAMPYRVRLRNQTGRSQRNLL